MIKHALTTGLSLSMIVGLALAGCSHTPKTDPPTPPVPEKQTTPPLPKEPTAPAPPKEPTAPALPKTPTAPPPKTTMSELRKDGNLGERHQRIVAAASQGGAEIAFIGDSITEGWAGAGREAWSAVWEPRHAVNCGIGGDRTQHVIGRLDNGLLDALSAMNNSIKWVVLMIGTNNTGGADSAADIAAGNEAIISRLRQRLPNAQIVLLAVFPRGQWPNPQRDMIDAINKRLLSIAARDAEHIHYIDIGPKFLKPTGELPPDLMPDFLHLSPAGYKIWSDELQAVIK